MQPLVHDLIVPLDQSPLAETILPYATTIAHATGARPVLLHIVAPGTTLLALSEPALIDPSIAQGWEHEETARARRYLLEIAAKPTLSTLDPRIEVRVSNDVGTAILAYAHRDQRASMIAMTTHGFTGFRHLVFGSVAQQVLHGASVPVLLLRARTADQPTSTSAPIRTIVVPLDGSAFAAQAVPHAQTIASATGAAIVLVAAVPALDDVGLAEGGVEPLWSLADRADEDQRVADDLIPIAQQITDQGIPVRTRIVPGAPAPTILTISAQEQADLIVLATHGRSGVSRLVLGSVAQSVVAHVEQPVLLVRPH